jgi:putative ABC transport system permease protein
VMLAAVAVPTLRLAAPALAADIAAGSRRSIGHRAAHKVRVALVSAQTALAIVLLATGALVVATLERTSRVDPGFDAQRVVAAQLRLAAAAHPTDMDRAVVIEQVIDQLTNTPGIVNAGTTLNPFSVGDGFQTLIHIEDRPSPDGQPYTVQFRRVTPGYFDTMRIRLLEGRLFDRHDRVDSPPVLVVSRSFARRQWNGASPVGRRIKRGASAREWSTVVGMVEDVRDAGLNQPIRDTLYSSYFQGSNAAAPIGLVVRTAADPSGSIDAIRRAVWAVDPKQPLGKITLLEQFM